MSDIELVEAEWCGVPFRNIASVEYDYSPLDVDGRLVEREDAVVKLHAVTDRHVHAEPGDDPSMRIVVFTENGAGEWRPIVTAPEKIRERLSVPPGTLLQLVVPLRRLPADG